MSRKFFSSFLIIFVKVHVTFLGVGLTNNRHSHSTAYCYHRMNRNERHNSSTPVRVLTAPGSDVHHHQQQRPCCFPSSDSKLNSVGNCSVNHNCQKLLNLKANHQPLTTTTTTSNTTTRLNSPTNQKRRRKRMPTRLSTEEHFCDRSNSASPVYTGAFGHIRKRLDYDYHSPYRKERQWFHDSIIEEFMDNNTGCHQQHEHDDCQSHNNPGNSTTTIIQVDLPENNPWLILVCGAYGAGKRHTTHRLVQSGRLPLRSFVYVDADEIRRVLPEYPSFCQSLSSSHQQQQQPTSTKSSTSSSPHALVDQLTQKECGYISETLALASLQAGRNVILDGGSLRDVEWYESYIADLRNEFPGLQTAVFHVTAQPATILNRAQERAQETKRIVPEACIQKALQELPENVSRLAKVVDQSFVIENEQHDDLSLVHNNKSSSWDEFTEAFVQQQPVEGIRCHAGPPDLQLESSVAMMMRRRSLRRMFSAQQSTETNHCNENKHEFHGKYAHIRATLDYHYHRNYTLERQRFQDSIISEYLDAAVVNDKNGQDICTTPTEPWIVFTAGAMGAGKSYTMRQLVEKGRFPLMAFVSVDPDDIRRQLPEFHLYVEQSPELAGELTRKEAGFIAEILTLAGLQAGKNVLVDGSLRDSGWYQRYFQRLRLEFPALRISILHITAPREAVFQRATDRAITTGRVVPRALLEAAIDQVPRSVQILAPLSDYCVEMNNAPKAKDIELVSPSETWNSFSSTWIQTCAWVPNREKMLQKKRQADQRLKKKLSE